MARKLPEHPHLQVPVYIPVDGEHAEAVVVGQAHLQNGKLVIAFGTTLAAEGIQRLFARGVFIGFTAVVLEEIAQKAEAEEKEVEGDAPTEPAE